MIHTNCGHVVKNSLDVVQCIIQSKTNQGSKAIEYVTLCLSCFEHYKHQNLIFDSEQQAKNWLKN